MSDSAESVKVVNMGNDSPPSTQKSNGQIIRKWGGGVQSGPKNPGGLDLDTIKPVEDSDKKEEKEKEPEPEPKPEKVVDDNDSEEEIDSSSDDGDIEENNNDEKPVKTEETEKDGGATKESDTDTSSEASTTELLSEDPLFLVLSEMLMSGKGNNVVDVLEKIHGDLKKLIRLQMKK